jgi:hypothetical protein
MCSRRVIHRAGYEIRKNSRTGNWEDIRRRESILSFMMRKNWMLGFLGFLGLLGFEGVLGFMKGDCLQAIWLVWFAFFAWFVYFLPEKEEPKVKP